jgi:two-component sensor histidine kinase
MPLALVLNELLTNAAKDGTNDRGRVNIDYG